MGKQVNPPESHSTTHPLLLQSSDLVCGAGRELDAVPDGDWWRQVRGRDALRVDLLQVLALVLVGERLEGLHDDARVRAVVHEDGRGTHPSLAKGRKKLERSVAEMIAI